MFELLRLGLLEDIVAGTRHAFDEVAPTADGGLK